jgi:hypothetical protein
MLLPRSQTGVGACTPTGSISFGSAFPIQFDGRASFSLGLWVQAQAVSPTAMLLQVADVCSFGAVNGTLTFRFASQISPLVGQFPLDDDWHYLVIVYASTQPYSGTLTMYYDSEMAGQAIISSLTPGPTGNALTVGGDAALNVWCVDIYDRALTPSGAGCDWTPDTPDPNGLVAAFCFMQDPPMDMGPNDYPIAFSGTAAEQIVTPGLQLTANASAAPSQDEGVSPGGGTTPYSLQAWVYGTDNGESQLVICNGNLDESAFGLGVLPSGNGLAVAAVRGGQTFSAGSFPLNEWHNIAATYDGTTLSVYLDGTLVGKTPSGSASAPAAGTLAIGAAFTSGGGLAAWFHGWVQCVDVWTTTLAAGDVATFMDVAPYEQTGCVAIYDFTGDAANGVTGSSVALLNGATLGQFFVTPPSDYPAQSARVAASRQRIHPTPPVGPVETPGRAAPLDDATAARLIATFGEALHPAVDDATRARAQQLFADGVQQAQQWLRETGRPLPGTITYTREGDEFVFWHHTTQGATVCYRMPATSECTAWWISLIATVILGILGVIGVPLSSSRVVNAIANRLGNGTVGRAIAKVLVEEVSTRTVVQAARIFFNLIAVNQFMSDVFANLRWYEILFIVGAVVLQIVEIMFPNPSTAAWVALKVAALAAVVVQLVIVVSEQPANCT